MSSEQRGNVLKAEHVEIATADVRNAEGKALEAIDSMHDAVRPTLVAVETARMHDEKMQRLAQISVVGALTAIAIFLATVMTRLIVQPLRQAIEVFGRIAAGDFSSRIEAPGEDEPSQVLHALDGMQSQLRMQLESERCPTRSACSRTSSSSTRRTCASEREPCASVRTRW